MEMETKKLSALAPAQTGLVAALEGRDAAQRRLLELGLIPGTRVQCLFTAPTGSPIAYQVRGSVIGLRRENADQIWVQPWS